MQVSKLRKVCIELSKATVSCRTFQILDVEQRFFFRPCLVASYAKNIEFALYVQRLRKKDDSFFILGTLRGICEDYIALKFLVSLGPTAREEVATWLFGRAQGESVRAQSEYFKRERPYQMVVSQPRAELDKFLQNVDAKLRNIGKPLGWNGRTAVPTTKQMAKSVGELDLYEYLFHATSALVHFNPKVLLEMGWGPLPGEMTFSPSNFHSYYYDFSLFYSALLLTKSCTAFADELGLSKEALVLAGEVLALLQGPGRWPELVTFEAMNLKPTAMDHALHIAKVMMEAEGESTEAASGKDVP